MRTEPVDLDGHLRRVQARADLLAEPLASVARDYVGLCAGAGIPAHAARTPLLRGPARPDRAPRRLSRAAVYAACSIAGRAQMKLATDAIPAELAQTPRRPVRARRPPAWPLGPTHAPPLEPATRRAVAPLLVARAGPCAAAARRARRLHHLVVGGSPTGAPGPAARTHNRSVALRPLRVLTTSIRTTTMSCLRSARAHWPT